MDALTRDRVLRLAGIELRDIPPVEPGPVVEDDGVLLDDEPLDEDFEDDEETDIDEDDDDEPGQFDGADWDDVEGEPESDDDDAEVDTEALTRHRTLQLLGIETRAKLPERIGKGFEGGGRFRSASSRLIAILKEWNGGEGDPLKGFTSVQLKTAAKDAGLNLPEGIKLAPLKSIILANRASFDEGALNARQLRADARLRSARIAQGTGTARLLAEVDELVAKGASLDVIRERLDPALTQPEQLFAGADEDVATVLRHALDSGDMPKFKAAVTRQSTKAGIKPIGRGGAKAAFDPDTMEGLGDAPSPGARVHVVRRGSVLKLANGSTVQLDKAKVTTVSPGAVRKGVPPKAAAKPKSLMSQLTADERRVARQSGLPEDHPLVDLANRIDNAPTRSEAEALVADLPPDDLAQVGRELGIKMPASMTPEQKREHVVQSVIAFGNAGSMDARTPAATPKAPNPDGLDSTATLRTKKQLAATIATDVVGDQPLPQGKTSATRIDTFGDGRRAVHKRALRDWNGLSPKDQTDAEELTATVGAAIGAPVPAVHRQSDDAVYIDFIDGTRGDEAGYAPYQLPTGVNDDDLRRLGLLDLLIANPDRFADNYMVNESGRVYGIDHAVAWSPTATAGGPEDAPTQPGTFGQAFIQPGGLFGSPQFKQGPFTAEELTDLRAKLVPLRGDFERLGHRDWYDYTLGRMDELIVAAGGSRKAAPHPDGLDQMDETARPSDVELEGRVRAAYDRLAREPGAFVTLADLRDELPGEDREQLDRVLVSMNRQQGIRVVPESNQKALTERHRDAAVRVGNQQRHAIAMDAPDAAPASPSVRKMAVPAAAVPGKKAVPGKVGPQTFIRDIAPDVKMYGADSNFTFRFEGELQGRGGQPPVPPAEVAQHVDDWVNGPDGPLAGAAAVESGRTWPGALFNPDLDGPARQRREAAILRQQAANWTEVARRLRGERRRKVPVDPATGIDVESARKAGSPAVAKKAAPRVASRGNPVDTADARARLLAAQPSKRRALLDGMNLNQTQARTLARSLGITGVTKLNRDDALDRIVTHFEPPAPFDRARAEAIRRATGSPAVAKVARAKPLPRGQYDALKVVQSRGSIGVGFLGGVNGPALERQGLLRREGDRFIITEAGRLALAERGPRISQAPAMAKEVRRRGGDETSLREFLANVPATDLRALADELNISIPAAARTAAARRLYIAQTVAGHYRRTTGGL